MPALQHYGHGEIRLLPKLRHLREAHVSPLRTASRSPVAKLRPLRDEVTEPDPADCVDLSRSRSPFELPGPYRVAAGVRFVSSRNELGCLFSAGCVDFYSFWCIE